MGPDGSILKMMIDSFHRQAFISKLDLRLTLRKVYDGYFKEIPDTLFDFGFEEFFQWALASGFMKYCATNEGAEIYVVLTK